MPSFLKMYLRQTQLGLMIQIAFTLFIVPRQATGRLHPSKQQCLNRIIRSLSSTNEMSLSQLVQFHIPNALNGRAATTPRFPTTKEENTVTFFCQCANLPGLAKTRIARQWTPPASGCNIGSISRLSQVDTSWHSSDEASVRPETSHVYKVDGIVFLSFAISLLYTFPFLVFCTTITLFHRAGSISTLLYQ